MGPGVKYTQGSHAAIIQHLLCAATAANVIIMVFSTYALLLSSSYWY